jgi:predicted nuclease of predicted toxin-antitoxin system
MSLSIVIDMNLSPEWAPLLTQAGWPATHWSQIGDPRAHNDAIMSWARAHSHIVFSHDLDFGTALALTGADGPSVIQIRTQRVLPEQVGDLVVQTSAGTRRNSRAGPWHEWEAITIEVRGICNRSPLVDRLMAADFRSRTDARPSTDSAAASGHRRLLWHQDR